MKKITTTIVTIASAALLCASNAFSETPQNNSEARGSMRNDPSSPAQINEILRKSQSVYNDLILRSPKGSIPTATLANAKCVAVIPELKTGALAIGGSLGDGVVSCKNNGTWSSPALIDVADISIGAQIGGKVSNVVLLFNNQKAATALREGKFRIGADASVAAGSYDAAATGLTDGVYAYQRSDGAYAGASFSGGNITADAEDNQRLYGKTMTIGEILSGEHITSSPALADGFTKLLPSSL